MEPEIILPSDMWNKINSYLEVEDLAQVDQTNVYIHKITSADYRLYLHKVKLKTEVVRENLEVLWNNPEGNFYVNSEGALKIISSWNLAGRVLKWIFDFNGIITKKVNDAAKLSLEEAFRLIIFKNESLSVETLYWFNSADKYLSTEFFNEFSYFLGDRRWMSPIIKIIGNIYGYRRPNSKTDSVFHNVNHLACKLSHSNQFKSIDKKIFNLFNEENFLDKKERRWPDKRWLRDLKESEYCIKSHDRCHPEDEVNLNFHCS